VDNSGTIAPPKKQLTAVMEDDDEMLLAKDAATGVQGRQTAFSIQNNEIEGVSDDDQ